jgi:hypothetical protein
VSCKYRIVCIFETLSMHKQLFFLFYFTALLVNAQETTDVKPEKWGDKIMNIQFNYTYIQPGGDLAGRFGNFHNVGFGGLFKILNNWTFAADVSYQFGTQVTETNFLYNLTNSNGIIMTGGGGPATFNIGMRGFTVMGKIGRVFPLGWRNPNSGIMIMMGGGVYYHKINIATNGNEIPSLTENYKKGYDRLSMGPALTQFVGYYYHSPSRYINFYIGLDLVQGFTQSVRAYNYDTNMPDTEKRTDITYGARIGWMIPIYLKSKTFSNEYEFK